MPDASPSLGFNGLFLPTAAQDATGRGISLFPAPDNPEVLLAAFRGNLGLDSGVPQSVYTLDTTDMVKVGLESLAPGQTWTLPNNSGSIEFAGLDRWASFQVAHDPGKEVALAAAVLAILSKVGVYVVLRLSLLLFGAGPSEGFGQGAILAAGLATIAYGTVGILAARDLTRAAGYAVMISSGTVLAVLGTGSDGALAGALYYLVGSTLAAGALFLLAEILQRGRDPVEAAQPVFADEYRDPFDDADAVEIGQNQLASARIVNYSPARTLPDLRAKARYIRVSPAGQKEAAPHDVIEVSTRASTA